MKPSILNLTDNDIVIKTAFDTLKVRSVLVAIFPDGVLERVFDSEKKVYTLSFNDGNHLNMRHEYLDKTDAVKDFVNLVPYSNDKHHALLHGEHAYSGRLITKLAELVAESPAGQVSWHMDTWCHPEILTLIEQ